MINPIRQQKIDSIQEKIGRKDLDITNILSFIRAKTVATARKRIKVVGLWNGKRTLQDQSDECVDFIYDLVK